MIPRLAAVLVLLLSSCARSGGIDIEDAYVRDPPPTRNVASGYFSATNHGTTLRKLVAAHTPAAERVEIHTHEHDGDMMRMRQVEALDLPPGKRVTLAPGGLHLMIFGVERFATDRIEMVLVFDDGTEQRVTFEVRRSRTAYERKRPAEESV
jgi:copper(I)-binding protein